MRAPSNIKQDIENVQTRLAELQKELHEATVIAYACVITPSGGMMASVSPEVPTTTEFGVFTYHKGLGFFYFHAPEMTHDMTLYYNAARFELDADPLTWDKPYWDNEFPLPQSFPCMVAIWQSKDRAEKWLAQHRNDFIGKGRVSPFTSGGRLTPSS